MARSVKILAVLMLAAAVPATAQTFGFSFGSAPQACLSIGNATYRIATNMLGADVTVQVAPAAAAPDIRIAFTETPDAADFVFVDDGNAPPACHNSARARDVRIEAAAVSPDIVVGLADAGAIADYRIYVRSRWLAPQAAAALFAAAHAPARKLASRLADRSN